MPKGYVIARVSVSDPDAYSKYASLARTAMETHGARILARGGRYEELEGPARPRNVILEFDDYETALKYWHSPEYQEARKHRLKAAEIELCVVEGTD